jgi:hypothetical protein
MINVIATLIIILLVIVGGLKMIALLVTGDSRIFPKD